MTGKFPVAGMVTAASLATAPFSGFLYRNREIVSVADLWRYAALYVGSLLVVVIGISFVFGKRTGSRWAFLLGWCACAVFWYRDIKSFSHGFFLTKAVPFHGPMTWALITLSVLIFIYFMCDRSWFPISGVLFAITMAVVPLGQFLVFRATTESYGVESFQLATDPDAVWESRPDIYFLLLDGFGRQDILNEMFDINTSGFISELRNNGFVVADRALGAHPMTYLSLAAILDQEYQAMPGESGWAPARRRQISLWAGASRTHRNLMANGYHFVTAGSVGMSFCSSSPISEIEDCVVDRPDVDSAVNASLIRYQIATLTPMVELTDGPFWPDFIARLWGGPGILEDPETVGGKAFLVRDILDVVDAVYLRNDSTPLFVFGHMMHTHPPFTLGPECEFQTRGVPDLSEGWDDVSGYQDAINCVMTQVLELIREVDPAAVIVIQADHGPIPGREENLYGTLGRLDDPDVVEDLWVRLGVLSAVRLPEHCRHSVSDTYAGVNTFKVIFSCLTGNPKSPIPERSHWGWWDSDRVVDVTDRLRTYEASRELTQHGVDPTGD